MEVNSITVKFSRMKRPADFENVVAEVTYVAALSDNEDHLAAGEKLMKDAKTVVLKAGLTSEKAAEAAGAPRKETLTPAAETKAETKKADKPAETKKAETKPAAEAPKAAEEKPAEKDEFDEFSEAAAPADEKPMTGPDLQTWINATIKSEGLAVPDVKAILEKFGVKRSLDLKESDRIPVKREIEALVAAKKAKK